MTLTLAGNVTEPGSGAKSTFAAAVPVQVSGTVSGAKFSVPPRETVNVAVSVAAVRASAGCVAVGSEAVMVTTFSSGRAARSAVRSSCVAPWDLALLGS